MGAYFNFWKRVFGNWRYSVIAFVIAILFYALNVLIANFNSLIDFYPSFGFFGSIKFFLVLMIGFINVIKWYSFISLIIISFFIGILFSLIFYRINIIKSVGRNGNFIGLIGIIIGAVAPGCAACGIGLASSLGLSVVFLNLLPLKGFEFSILSILILAFALYKVSNESCKIEYEE